jgi:hypothetical protein
MVEEVLLPPYSAAIIVLLFFKHNSLAKFDGLFSFPRSLDLNIFGDLFVNCN